MHKPVTEYQTIQACDAARDDGRSGSESLMKLWKITRKASDVAEYIALFGSSTRDRHARHI